MYSEIMQKKALKFTQRQTARYLGISRNTVKKYWNMDAGTFNNLLCSQGREKKLTRYDQIIIEWLTKYPDMSAAKSSRLAKRVLQS